MQLTKLFSPVTSMSPDEARQFMARHEEGSFTLLDVRQPGEYKQSHIPGAVLAPLPDLLDSLDKLDPDKPTLVYCASGGRSRVGAQLLSGKGFKQPINLSGGIKAWEGLTASGPVEMNLDLVWADAGPQTVVMTAYGMEHALAEFYRIMESRTDDRSVAELLGKLAGIEERHKQYLLDLYNTISPDGSERKTLETAQSTMEGGFDLTEFLRENEQFAKTAPNLVDLAMMLETQALDLYLRFADKVARPESREILFKIADEEKGHLRSLGKLKDLVG
jgi:sulfur-carrier protein adenylyltransferase/sulfurtransferase